ncbi:hypothetical protein PR048_029422 [Dryococelus australis]|uniref:Uncharacterized protein n=1 Tax=Dryococelus australis TaxID=614101 RepID=A0ABQ9GFQ1_9NEOP|nr:hypothetical protein PR048_029422 [Dryococelus australis]
MWDVSAKRRLRAFKNVTKNTQNVIFYVFYIDMKVDLETNFFSIFNYSYFFPKLKKKHNEYLRQESQHGVLCNYILSKDFTQSLLDLLLIHKKGIRKSLREITVEKYNEAKAENIKIIPAKFLCTNCWARISELSCATDSNYSAYELSSRTIENVNTACQLLKPRKIIVTSFDVQYVEEGLFVEFDNSDEYSSEYLGKSTTKLVRKYGILPETINRKQKPFSQTISQKVIEFYENDNSRICPGKKYFVSFRTQDGTKIHKQKQLILCNLKELYNKFKFKSVHPSLCVGFSKFAQL